MLADVTDAHCGPVLADNSLRLRYTFDIFKQRIKVSRLSISPIDEFLNELIDEVVLDGQRNSLLNVNFVGVRKQCLLS